MMKIRPNLTLKNGTPYLALVGEILGIFRESFNENLP